MTDPLRPVDTDEDTSRYYWGDEPDHRRAGLIAALCVLALAVLVGVAWAVQRP